MGMRAFGIVFVIIILLSSGTFVNAAPPSGNPGQPIDDILAELEEVLAELAAIREDTEDLQEEVGEVKADTEDLQSELTDVKDVTNTIRGTVQESFVFELEIGDTVGGALQFILVDTCAPEAVPCSLMSVKKIVTPDAGILPVFVLLCTDVLVCHILHGQDEISVGISAGIAFGIGALGDVEIDLEEPLISPIPINLLFASGLGEVSFSRVLVLTNLPGYEGTVKFIGEKPLDVTLTGAYIDGAGLHCFNEDGDSVGCDDVADALLGDGDICFDTDLFPVPAIDDAIAAIIALGEEEGFDLSPPEETTVCEICLDGSLDCPIEIPLLMKGSPLETCMLDTNTDQIVCETFVIDVEGIVNEEITQIIDDIDETIVDIEGVVGDIEGFVDKLPAIQSTINAINLVVGDIEGFVDNLPAIQSTINTIDSVVATIGRHIQQILDDLPDLGDFGLGGSSGSGGNSGGCFIENPFPPPACIVN